ncbi:MAG: glycoside hydrolase family 5 protein [Minisyncoccota bacterium]
MRTIKHIIAISVTLVFTFFISVSPPVAHAASLTEAQVQSVLSLLSSFGVSAAIVTSVAADLKPSHDYCVAIGHNLTPGATSVTTNNDVSTLQTFLTNTGLYNARITGYYGPITVRAVQNFQRTNNIVSFGTPSTTGYGATGPVTRAFISRGCTGSSGGRTGGTTTPSSSGNGATVFGNGNSTVGGGSGVFGGFVPDATPPSTPTSLTATVVSPSRINLNWSASVDNVGVTGYRIYRNGTQITTTTGTSYSDTGLTISTAYSYTIAAYDAAGNVSTQSSAASAVTAADTAPPLGGISGSNAFSVAVSGNHFVDGNGNTIQLRGVNFSGFDFVPIQGWSPSDPSGGQGGQPDGPKWSAIRSWGANIVRIPLNETSWLGYTCTDTSGVAHNPDPGGNYKSAIATQVAEANAAGLYVILDLHWAAPGTTCPLLQTQMADADHSLAFWTSIATTYKNNPAVLFELFNEPFLNFDFTGNAWTYMMSGTNGSFSGYPATSGSNNWKNIKTPWAIASYQDMLNAVRATGAKNIVLVGTMQYSQDLSSWLTTHPTDPLNQMAAAWHPYPSYGTTWGTPAYAQPNYAPGVFNDVQNILAAGIPVIATETGDRDTAGTVGAPLVSTVTSWVDQHGVSLLGWTWDVWGNSDNVLIKDVNGTPTDGYGQVFKAWLLSHTATSTGSPSSSSGTTATIISPYIQDFSPRSGPVGTVVTFTGTGFTGLDEAWAGNAHDAVVSVVSDTEATVTIPADATTGAIGIHNAAGWAFSAQAFTVQ